MPHSNELIRSLRLHKVEECDFKAGRILCSCSVLVTANPDPAFDRTEELAAAWLEHRRDVGTSMKPRPIGFDR